MEQLLTLGELRVEVRAGFVNARRCTGRAITGAVMSKTATFRSASQQIVDSQHLAGALQAVATRAADTGAGKTASC